MVRRIDSGDEGNVKCQGERGAGSLTFVLVDEDSEEDSVPGGSVPEGPYGQGSAPGFPEAVERIVEIPAQAGHDFGVCGFPAIRDTRPNSSCSCAACSFPRRLRYLDRRAWSESSPVDGAASRRPATGLITPDAYVPLRKALFSFEPTHRLYCGSAPTNLFYKRLFNLFKDRFMEQNARTRLKSAIMIYKQDIEII